MQKISDSEPTWLFTIGYQSNGENCPAVTVNTPKIVPLHAAVFAAFGCSVSCELGAFGEPVQRLSLGGCVAPLPPKHGRVQVTAVPSLPSPSTEPQTCVIGSPVVAQYACDVGYILYYGQNCTCSGDGEWVPIAPATADYVPECRTACHALDPPSFGHVDTSNNVATCALPLLAHSCRPHALGACASRAAPLSETEERSRPGL